MTQIKIWNITSAESWKLGMISIILIWILSWSLLVMISDLVDSPWYLVILWVGLLSLLTIPASPLWLLSRENSNDVFDSLKKSAQLIYEISQNLSSLAKIGRVSVNQILINYCKKLFNYSFRFWYYFKQKTNKRLIISFPLPSLLRDFDVFKSKT